MKRGLCAFDVAWIGACGEKGYFRWRGGNGERFEPPVKAVAGERFCKYNLGMKCGNQGCERLAVGECDEASSLVCGVPYCARCGRHFHARGGGWIWL